MSSQVMTIREKEEEIYEKKPRDACLNHHNKNKEINKEKFRELKAELQDFNSITIGKVDVS